MGETKLMTRGIVPAHVPIVKCARLLVFAISVLGTTLIIGCGPKKGLPSRSETEWKLLLEATQDPQKARAPEIDPLLQGSLVKEAPMWPVDAFLKAEIYRSRGDLTKAYDTYSALSEWGCSDPNKDGWGGSGLTIIAISRRVEMDRRSYVDDKKAVKAAETKQAIECAKKLQATRLAKGMFSSRLLQTVPQVEEQLVRGLAQLSWLIHSQEDAKRFYLDYLRLARTNEQNTWVEDQIWKSLIDSRQVSEDHLKLLNAQRLRSLGWREEAADLFQKLLDSNEPDVRAEAGYDLVDIRGVRREKFIPILNESLKDATDPLLAQQVLLRLAREYDAENNSGLFVQTLNQLIVDYPDGSLVSEALYTLARHFQKTGDIDEALKYFRLVEEWGGKNDWFERAYYQSMLTLYGRASPSDLPQATQQLKELLDKRPNASLRINAMFWLGRLAESSGETEQARNYYAQVIKESPYNYYSIRARMHQQRGSEISSQLWPDAQTQSELKIAYRERLGQPANSEHSVYKNRLTEVLQDGLYSDGVKAVVRLQHDFAPKRVEQLNRKEFDESGMFAGLILLLSFRQDAIAASDSYKDPRNGQVIAAALGEQAQDWPMTITLLQPEGESEQQQSAIQSAPGFLFAAYPVVFQAEFAKAGLEFKVPPELLYAVARQESFFFPMALSSQGAMGLFQFTKPTFELLNKRWDLLKSAGVGSFQDFVENPNLSSSLWARWFHEELLPGAKGNTLFALDYHAQGYILMREWVNSLQQTTRSDDVEYAIEINPAQDTRIFLKRLITDASIISAAGVLTSHADPKP